MLRFAVPALAISLSLLSTTSHANPSTDTSAALTETAPEPTGALRLDLGLFSPIGEIGVVYSRPVHELAAIELGAGLGFSGLQLSAMGKLRTGNERTKFTPGAGLSVGLPVLDSSAVHAGHPMGEDEMRGPSVTMAWLDLDLLGVEHRTRSGVVLSASAGVTMALTSGHWDAADLGDDIHRFDTLPQFRMGIGKAF